MKRKMRKDKIELEFRPGPAWDGNISGVKHVVPDGYNLSEVKRAGNRYTFVYLKDVPRM